MAIHLCVPLVKLSECIFILILWAGAAVRRTRHTRVLQCVVVELETSLSAKISQCLKKVPSRKVPTSASIIKNLRQMAKPGM